MGANLCSHFKERNCAESLSRREEAVREAHWVKLGMGIFLTDKVCKMDSGGERKTKVKLFIGPYFVVSAHKIKNRTDKTLRRRNGDGHC